VNQFASTLRCSRSMAVEAVLSAFSQVCTLKFQEKEAGWLLHLHSDPSIRSTRKSFFFSLPPFHENGTKSAQIRVSSCCLQSVLQSCEGERLGTQLILIYITQQRILDIAEIQKHPMILCHHEITLSQRTTTVKNKYQR